MTTLPSSKLQTCWNQTGIAGDRSCPELLAFTHCRNCPVYSIEGRRLLERAIPDGYVQEWTTLLATAQTAQTMASPSDNGSALPTLQATHSSSRSEGIAVVIFRVHREWLALPARLFKEVTPSSRIHTIPHRSNQILLGLVNIRGELQMCVSLAHLLTLETVPPTTPICSMVAPRLMVLEWEGEPWVFPVDEIYGVQRFPWSELKPTPTHEAKSTQTYAKGLMGWRDTHISLLDDDLLFYTLSRRVL